jgi:hypothetical protein
VQREIVIASLAFGLTLAMLPSARGAPGQATGSTPEAIRERRAALYLEAAKQPLSKLASQIYDFASDSERCRLESGAQACGLLAGPLKGKDLKQIFDYYVKLPVKASLDQKKVDARKSHWIWQAAPNTRR